MVVLVCELGEEIEGEFVDPVQDGRVGVGSDRVRHDWNAREVEVLVVARGLEVLVVARRQELMMMSCQPHPQPIEAHFRDPADPMVRLSA